MVPNVATALCAYFLLQTVSLHIGYGLHIQVMRINDISYGVHNLVRQKRYWIIPPVNIFEESDNSARNPIAIIQSDVQLEEGRQIFYKISGKGATEPPYHLFVINETSGALNITGIVDREETPIFYLTGYAVDQNGVQVEKPIPLRIKVLDINDHAPVFTQEVFYGAVEEMSSKKTLVMRLNATDADEENTINTQLAFKFLSHGQPSIFEIKKDSAEIYTLVSSIDREQQSSYTLTVEVKDRGGNATGLTGKSTVHIKILDVNDNIPKFEKKTYEGSIEENTANVEILRMKILDEDEEHTDNWLANFTILSGNENGYFKIETDSATNEGVLVLVKEVDYEELQNLDLKVVVSNKAAYHSSILSSSSSKEQVVPIRVKVKNVHEGPIFKPKIKYFNVSENTKTTVKNQIIGSYLAYDEDTGKIAYVKYAKEYDADNWFTIDATTSEIRLSKIPDRESSYVVNGTYIAKILAIGEGKTATGTIAIQVEDINDNCPTIVNPIQNVCEDVKYINVTAQDQDSFPFGAPFTFVVVDEPKGTAENWIIGRTDATSIQLVPQNLEQYNQYEVPILIKDMQGFRCPEIQMMKVTVCTCASGGGCMDRLSKTSTTLGAGAIGLMILAFLLLLLVPLLLLLCYCGGSSKGFTAIPDGPVEILRNWNSEGAQPKDMARLPSAIPRGYAGQEGAGMKGEGAEFGRNGMKIGTRGMYITAWEEHRKLLHTTDPSARGTKTVVGAAERFLTAGDAAGAAWATLNEEFLKGYFGDKATSYADEDETKPAKDCLLVYCQEGMGSPTGSVGCCSFFDDDLEEDLLDNLGPKFKTLAEICLGKQLITDLEISQHHSHGQHSDVPSGAGKVVSASSVYAGDQPRAVSSEQTYSVYESSIHAPELDKVPEMVTQQSVYTEESSRTGLQSARSISDPHVHGSILVTEKSYTTGPTIKSPLVVLDPHLQQNVLVTERVVDPASDLQGIIDIPELSQGQNIVVTERLIKADSGVPGLLVVNERPDSQYLVVTERLLAPSSGLQTGLSIPDLTDGQNIVVTERLYTPIDSLPGSMRVPSKVSGTHTVVKERNVSRGGVQEHLLNADLINMRIPSEVSGTHTVVKERNVSRGGVQEHLPNADLLINQPSIVIREPSASNHNLSQSTSKVTKYSTVEYTHS